MAKKTIMLVCSAGMSTKFTSNKMQKAAEAKGMTRIFSLCPLLTQITTLQIKDVDVLLLGPQVRFYES